MSLLLLAYLVFAQATAPLEFGVASIRPSATSPQGKVDIGIHIDGAQIRCISFSLKDYLGIAYRVKAQQIEGPEWLTSERFDVVATMPEGGSAAGTASANGIGVNLGHGASYSFADHKFTATKLTMAQVAANLEPFANRSIVDKTASLAATTSSSISRRKTSAP